MKPKLKPPGNNRLTVKCDMLLSNFAFKFNLRRYIKARRIGGVYLPNTRWFEGEEGGGLTAGAYTRPLLSSISAVSDTKCTINTP
jgi:hypothetical protein